MKSQHLSAWRCWDFIPAYAAARGVRYIAAESGSAHLDASHIRIETNKGTVTLQGLAERDTIEQAAWNAPGVQKVVDNLTVAS